MCYHVSTPSKEKLKVLKPKVNFELDPDHNGFFHVSGFVRPFLPVTLNSDPDTLQLARWKLIPFWVKTEEEAAKYANTLNAEGESIFEKASYKRYVGSNRGLLYVDGFYEPHKVAGVKDTENYFLFLPEKEVFTLGIVWAEFAGYPTFTVVTTPANPQLEIIHNEKKRMPFVVAPADREAWLHASDPVEIKALIRPWNGGEFQAHRVARVTAMRGDTNNPEIQKEV